MCMLISLTEASKGCIWEPREVIPRIEPDYNRLETLFAETRILGVNDEVGGQGVIYVTGFVQVLESCEIDI